MEDVVNVNWAEGIHGVFARFSIRRSLISLPSNHSGLSADYETLFHFHFVFIPVLIFAISLTTFSQP